MKNWTLILVAIVLCFGCAKRRESPIPAANEQAKKKAAVEQAKTPEEKAKAIEDAKFVWPPLLKEGEKVESASNVLAKNYLVVMDSSGSMSDQRCCEGSSSKSEAAKAALYEFVKSVPEEANLGLVYFQRSEIVPALPLGQSNRDQFMKFVNNTRPNGGTPLTEAVAEAYKLVSRQAQMQNGYGEYTIVVVTDGIADNEPSLDRTVQFILDNTSIAIYTIGFCIGEKHSLNRAGVTYRDANNPAELASALQGVLAESPEFSALEFEPTAP